MKVRDAATRAVRTALQAFVGAAAFGAVAVFRDFADVRKVGVSFLLAACLGVAAGVVAFAQNLAEDNTPVPAVK